jgi:hypothetical protein
MSSSSDPDATGGSLRAGKGGVFRQIAADLRRGHNIELYITVAVAVTVALLGILNVANVGVIGAATLAVLALLATSSLAGRHQTEEITARLDRVQEAVAGQAPAERFLSSRLPALDAEVATASDIGLVGVTLTRTVRDLLPILDRRLKAGASVRVLLIDLDSDAQTAVVARSTGAHAPDFYRHRISSTIDLLRLLASSPRSEAALQLRVLPLVPTFGMCLIDPAQEHGRIHVEIYQHRTLEANPSFSLMAGRDGRWYTLFAEQFTTLWESARPYPLSKTE